MSLRNVSNLFAVNGKSHPDRRLAVWDIRSFKKPIFTSPRIPTLYPETNAMFSPDEKLIVTGAAAPKTDSVVGRGALMFLRREGLDVEKKVDFEVNETVVKVVWHSKINQVRLVLVVMLDRASQLTHPNHRFSAAYRQVEFACSTLRIHPPTGPSFCSTNLERKRLSNLTRLLCYNLTSLLPTRCPCSGMTSTG